MKKLILLFFMVSIASLGYAKESEIRSDELAIEGADKIVKVEVKGLVCDFCARALDKIFRKQPEVAGIDVDLDDKRVTIGFKEGKMLDDKAIKKLINASGYTVEKIHRG
ncbi:MAG: heavy-metal-associated domain-containing protein [Verrucomicrobiota bacterium]